ncbi:alpha-ketoglutarate-dependent dioxygenase AlkB [Synechococcus elongatus IITB4]|uniref:alpha-ketoglutarate-dependent dioxygenase AlkB family protein n=1 Tax=Synechococcus elongatus TaxID=32046 RepID=UPI0030CE737C
MSQLDLFSPPVDTDPEPQRFLLSGGEVVYYPGLFAAEAQQWFSVLNETIEWRQDCIQLFGKSVPIPRENAWYGDPGRAYTYSGNPMTPLAWTPELQMIRQRVEEKAGERYNSVLLNRYRHGQDSVDWHADNEPELKPRQAIASVSLGASRKFRLKHRYDRELPKLEFLLKAGDLLIMRGATQENWLHQVPKTRQPVEPRINLTFRVIHF